MHTCPECGSACCCGGDIDDIDTGDEEAEDNCTCCAEGETDEEDYDASGDFCETCGEHVDVCDCWEDEEDED